MSLDEVAKKYPEAKELPKFRDMAAENAKEYPKFGFFCMFKILSDLATLRKANPQEPMFAPIMDKVKAMAEKYKKDNGANFNEDQDEFKEFVVKKFMDADNLVRTGKATPQTIIDLIDSSHMMEMLTIFGPLTEKTLKFQKYAKGMAVKLKRNLQETGDVNKGSAYKATGLEGGSQQPSQQTSQDQYSQGGAGSYGQPPVEPYNPTGMNGYGQPSPSPYNNTQNYGAPPAQNYADHAPHDIPDEPIHKVPVMSHNFAPSGGANTNFGQSMIRSHEKGLLDILVTKQPQRILEPLNSLFKVEVKRMSSNTGGATNVSFFNSSLYRNNRDEFESRGFELQDELKKCTGTLTTDLASTYANLCKLKQMMLDILKS